jgi:hypothetical protein
MSLGGYSDHAKVSSIRYEHPVLSAENPIEFEPKGLWTPTIDADNIAYRSMFQPFNLNQYLYPRPPIDMGLTEPIHGGSPNVLRMPLKFPGTIYKIPRELEALVPLIQRVAEYEKFLCTDRHVNPDATFCHITCDFSNVSPGEYHRYPGFHGDGIQGTKLTPKVYVEHSYILTWDPPTEFCLQPFFLKHLDEAKHNYFLEFDRQAKEVNVYGSLPRHLYLIDPYMVHRTPKIKQRTSRLFLRITYAFTELQHPKNTINPLFDGQEYHKRIDIRENLCANEFEVPWQLYGLSKGNQ